MVYICPRLRDANPDALLVGVVLTTLDRYALEHSEHKHRLPFHKNPRTYEVHLLLLYPKTGNCVLYILLDLDNRNNVRRSGDAYLDLQIISSMLGKRTQV